MNEHKRIKIRYDYSINNQQLVRLRSLFLETQSKSRIDLVIAKSDWSDFLFVLRTQTSFYLKSKTKSEENIQAVCVQLNRNSSFRVVKKITTSNHPHIDQSIPVGSVLQYSEEPTYGVANRYKGIPLKVGESFYQINYEYIELVDPEVG
jgi:hypothetical protein